MKTLFEQHGGTYTIHGNYRLPNLTVEETDYLEFKIVICYNSNKTIDV